MSGGIRAGLFALVAYADSRSSGRWTGAFEAPAANTGVSPLAAQWAAVSHEKVRFGARFSKVCGMCPAFAVVAEVVRQGLARFFSSWLRLRGGHRAQPKVAQAMAGEAALRRVSKAQAVRRLFRAFGLPGNGRYLGLRKLEPFTRLAWKQSRLVARRGSLRNGGRRAGRPATSCQRSCIERT